MSTIQAEQQSPASVSLEIGGKAIIFETGKLAGRRRCSRHPPGETMVPGDGCGPAGRATRADFFPSRWM